MFYFGIFNNINFLFENIKIFLKMKTTFIRRGFAVNQKETPPILKTKDLIFRNLKRPEQPKYYELFPKSKHHLCDTIDVENPWLFMNQE